MAGRKAAKKGRTAKTVRRGQAKSASARKTGARRGGRAATAGKSRQPAKKATGSGASPTRRQKLYTLTEVGRLASVSMPTLQKYKRMYADRIPSVGEGRRQRYPRAAVAVLRQLKKENLAKRGRPPGSGRAASKKRAATRSSGATGKTQGLLTLTEIGRRTGISYPTLSRYVKLFLPRIPHVGTGRSRRFPPAAVAVFRQLRSESRPGRPPRSGAAARVSQAPASTAALNARLRQLEKAQLELTKQVAKVVKMLQKPLQVTIKGR